ncbi:hypothetical protein NDU88_007267 [Pleurodeles waltl]|uniref:Uncharacterized protein n=1 Tax=Pleurodeles waltl TaxID=8319 RepID=A0AAV7VPZ2_PLEWA|nr:hypothetical protein NDU88_007267 [Pleurodeles waltl]
MLLSPWQGPGYSSSSWGVVNSPSQCVGVSTSSPHVGWHKLAPAAPPRPSVLSKICCRHSQGSGRARPCSAQAPPTPIPKRLGALLGTPLSATAPFVRALLLGAACSKLVSGLSGSPSPRPSQGLALAGGSVLLGPHSFLRYPGRHRLRSRLDRLSTSVPSSSRGDGPQAQEHAIPAQSHALGHIQGLVTHPLIPTGSTPKCRHRLSLRPARYERMFLGPSRARGLCVRHLRLPGFLWSQRMMRNHALIGLF